MKISSLLRLSYAGVDALLVHRKRPIIGSIIVTDRCNLSCKHCAVKNISKIDYTYAQIKLDMEKLYSEGVRILLFYGGEPFFWRDGERILRDLVAEARAIGFAIVNVVTNGTLGLDIPEADTIMVSLDGCKSTHDFIRGETYDTIIKNISGAAARNICLYMAVNQLNKGEIREVCNISKQLEHVKSVSFNFHTPYPGTDHLSLSREDKAICAKEIVALIDEGYPILNLKSALPYIVENSFRTPCHQCVIVENGERWTCGRCIEVEGLCENCGFFFAAEISLAFGGNILVLLDLLRTYLKYI